MIIKWVEWEFICDVCHSEVRHWNNEHVKSEAIKDLKDTYVISDNSSNSLKGWIIKGNSVTCNECKLKPIEK